MWYGRCSSPTSCWWPLSQRHSPGSPAKLFASSIRASPSFQHAMPSWGMSYYSRLVSLFNRLVNTGSSQGASLEYVYGIPSMLLYIAIGSFACISLFEAGMSQLLLYDKVRYLVSVSLSLRDRDELLRYYLLINAEFLVLRAWIAVWRHAVRMLCYITEGDTV